MEKLYLLPKILPFHLLQLVCGWFGVVLRLRRLT